MTPVITVKQTDSSVTGKKTDGERPRRVAEVWIEREQGIGCSCTGM